MLKYVPKNSRNFEIACWCMFPVNQNVNVNANANGNLNESKCKQHCHVNKNRFGVESSLDIRAEFENISDIEKRFCIDTIDGYEPSHKAEIKKAQIPLIHMKFCYKANQKILTSKTA